MQQNARFELNLERHVIVKYVISQMLLKGMVCLSMVLCLFLAPRVCLGDEARGIKLTDRSSISPFIEGSFTYDDNVFLDPPGDEDDDFYLDLTIGLSFLRQTEGDNLNIQGWLQHRKYSTYTELDDNTWQERVEYVRGNPDRMQIRLKQRHGALSDYEFTQSDVSAASERREATQRLIETRTRRTARDLDDLEAALARETRRLEMQVRAAYAAVDFERSDYSLYNWYEYHLDPFIGLRISEKTTVTLSGSIGSQVSENELGELQYLRGLLGVRYYPTEKTKVTVGGGLQQHTVPDDPSLDSTGFHFDAKAMWATTEKLTLQGYGRNEYQPTSAFATNTKRVDQGSVGAIYDLTRRIFATAGVSYRADNYTAPVGGVDALETHKGLQLKLNVRNKKKNITIYLRGRYEIFESNIQNDYNQLRLMLGANIAI